MDRNVVAFDAPPPRGVGRRRSKDREVIKLGVARETAARAFQLRQDRLEAHDRRGLLIAGRAQAGLHKLHRQPSLILIEVFERDSFAVPRDDGPIATVLAGEIESRFGLLFWR